MLQTIGAFLVLAMFIGGFCLIIYMGVRDSRKERVPVRFFGWMFFKRPLPTDKEVKHDMKLFGILFGLTLLPLILLNFFFG